MEGGLRMDTVLLRKLQLAELDILKDIHRFCLDNQIYYSLYAGTALGAVRHSGFIPWDDDVDIIMTSSEYVKFIEAWKKNPLKGYFLQNGETDPKCGITHTKIRKDGTVLLSKGEDLNSGHHGIWIDIFVFYKVSDVKILKYRSFFHGVMGIILSRGYAENTEDNKQKQLIKSVLKVFPEGVQRQLWHNNSEWLKKETVRNRNQYKWVSYSALYSMKILHSKEVPKHYTKIRFEGHYFMIFRDYDEMLTSLYGDYMKLPPVEKRVYTHNPVLLQFENESP